MVDALAGNHYRRCFYVRMLHCRRAELTQNDPHSFFIYRLYLRTSTQYQPRRTNLDQLYSKREKQVSCRPVGVSVHPSPLGSFLYIPVLRFCHASVDLVRATFYFYAVPDLFGIILSSLRV